MLGKYTISCFGGPDDILGSFARRIAERERSLLWEAEVINLKVVGSRRLEALVVIMDMKRIN